MAKYVFKAKTKNSTVKIVGVNLEEGVTEGMIPAMLDERSVTSIRRSAFEDCIGLISVEIPSSVTYVGDEAFSKEAKLLRLS
jgi:hypothetical protein